MSVVGFSAVSDSLTCKWGMPVAPVDVRERGSFVVGNARGVVPPWVGSVLARMQDLDATSALEPFGARQIDIDDALEAVHFLVRNMRDDTVLPWIGRLSSGGIQLAWNQGDVEVEAVFDSLRDEHVVVVAVGDNEWDANVRDADQLFANVVDRLSRHDVAAPAPA